MLMTTENQMATPPNMAVGFLCQRSVLGLATTPKRRANALTSGVRTRARPKAAATGSSVRGLKGIFNQVSGDNPVLCKRPNFRRKTIRYGAAKQAGQQNLGARQLAGTFRASAYLNEVCINKAAPAPLAGHPTAERRPL